MKVELHCHSNLSDGTTGVKSIIKKADNELGAIAITDHNDSRSYRLAKKAAKKVVVIPGVEIRCAHEKTKGDVLVLGADIGYRKPKKCPELLDVIDIAHDSGAVVINAHPYSGIVKVKTYFIDKKICKKFDAIEVLNGLRLMSRNKKAMELAKSIKKPMTAGSDAHLLKYIGEFACDIDADNADEIIECIRKGKVTLPKKKTMNTKILSLKMKRQLGKMFG